MVEWVFTYSHELDMGLGRIVRSLICSFLIVTLTITNAFADSSNVSVDIMSQVERIIRSTESESLEVARATYALGDKYSDIGITDIKLFTQITSQGGASVPIAAIQGEFYNIFSDAEITSMGRQMMEDKSSAIFFTTPERADEAAAFKITFEKQFNSDGTRKKITIVTIDERFQAQLHKDAQIQKESVIKRFAYRTKEGFREASEFLTTASAEGLVKAVTNTDVYKIAKDQITPSTKREKHNAIKWGVVSVGVNTAMFLAFGNIDPTLAISTVILNTAISSFLSYNEIKISNLFKAHMFRPFRVASEKRRSLEQLVVLTTVQSSVGVQGGSGNLDLAITPEAIAAGLVTQKGQSTLEAQVKRAVTDQAAERIVNYVKMMNIVLSSLATAGFVGFKVDATFAEVSALQIFIVAANLSLNYAVKKYHSVIRKLGTFNLKITTRQSFIRYRNQAVKSMKLLRLKADFERATLNVNLNRVRQESYYSAPALSRSPAQNINKAFIVPGLPSYSSAMTCQMLFGQ